MQCEYNRQVRENGGTTRNMEANRAFLAPAEALMPEGEGGLQGRQRRRAPRSVEVLTSMDAEANKGVSDEVNEPRDDTLAATVVLTAVE